VRVRDWRLHFARRFHLSPAMIEAAGDAGPRGAGKHVCGGGATMARPVVLVHGAWHGSWCWERVTPHLDQAGVPWTALDLPSCAKAASGPDVEADTVAVEAALDQLPGDEPAVLCGHSRGGLMVTEAGTHPRVGELVSITAMLVAPGQNLAEAIGPATSFNHVARFDDGTSIPQGDAVAPLLYNDCSPDDAAWAASRLRPMHPAAPTTSAARERSRRGKRGAIGLRPTSCASTTG
jgi:pimeloyl-ACP methyl ester carboxylesterase